MVRDTAQDVLDEVVGDMRRLIRVTEFEEGKVPKKGRFVHYILIGPQGAVQFAYMWHEAFVEEPFSHSYDGMMGVDVGAHSPTPRYEGQPPKQGCDLVLGQDHCYYDGSSLRADSWLQMWLESDRNDEVIWMALKNEYDATFMEGS